MDRNPGGKRITGFTKRIPVPREAAPPLDSQPEPVLEGTNEEFALSPNVDSGDLSVATLRRALTLPPQLDRKKSRLALMPLTVLLPDLGEPGRLHAYRQHFTRRLQELGALESGEDRQREHTAEEIMLNQITKWLSLGQE